MEEKEYKRSNRFPNRFLDRDSLVHQEDGLNEREGEERDANEKKRRTDLLIVYQSLSQGRSLVHPVLPSFVIF